MHLFVSYGSLCELVVKWHGIKDVDRYEFVLVLFYALLKRECCGWQFYYFFDG
jgi:hypothetical protein